MRILLALLFLMPALLSAAEVKAPRTGGAGKADAEVAFARQAGQAPEAAGAEPVVRGAYVWGGRADEQYKPFFQWELRLRAGSADLEQLRGRTITLMPDGSDAAAGGWVDLGRLAAGETRDVSIRQNCAAFNSYRLELTWTGGSATFVAADRTTVPVSASTFATMAYLVTTGYLHAAEESKADQRKRAGKGFPVSWWLWNIGGADATEVVQTVRFLDLNGKEVQREVVTLKDPVKAGARLEQVLTLKEKPKDYQAISVTADCAVPLVAIGAGAEGFTGAAEVEVAGIALANGSLSARVRNGLARDLGGLVVTVTLLDAAGTAVEAVPLTVGDLAAGAERAVSGAVRATGFAGYEIGWDVARSPAAPSAATPAPALTVDGVSFTTQTQALHEGSLFVKGLLEHARSAPLQGLSVTFTAQGGGATATVTWTADSLPAATPIAVALAFPGLTRLESLTMTWKAQ